MSIEAQLLTFLARRYRAHADRDLTEYVVANHLFHAVDPALVDFMHSHRQAIADYLARPGRSGALVEYCLRATKRYTYQRNQFINYTRRYNQLLRAEYADLFAQLGWLLRAAADRDELAQAITQLVERHHQRLRLILASYCAAYQAANLAAHPLLQTVPCGEYSARFQLQVLGLDLADLREPILDLGCGSAGNLVTFLRHQGFEAFGVDRLAPAGEHFFQADWFEFDYARAAWGTVIAHHALSTHFIYHHLHDRATARRYAELYLAILGSLVPGGSFCYAPGAPFFEGRLRQLPRYQVSKIPIAANSAIGLEQIAYATRITA